MNQLKLRNTVSIKTNAEDGTVTRVAPTNREQMLNSVHYGQTFLHGVQVFISYILMLVVMLCNMWLIIAICLGAALGYFIFGWMKKVPCQDSNECCYWSTKINRRPTIQLKLIRIILSSINYISCLKWFHIIITKRWDFLHLQVIK